MILRKIKLHFVRVNFYIINMVIYTFTSAMFYIAKH